MRNTKIFIAIVLICLCNPVNGQDGFVQNNDSIASARVPGSPLPKGLEINYSRQSGANIETIAVSGDFKEAQARIDGVSFIQFKLKIPLMLQPRTTLLVGLDYNERRYNFEHPGQLESSVFREIEREVLKSREVTLYFNKGVDKKHFINARLDLALNGDLRNIDNNRFTSFLRISAAALYGWQPHENLAHGVGLYLNYTLGRPSIYPVFLWNKTINDQWGIEAKLPATFKMRRALGSNSRIYFGYRLSGNTYVINGRFEPLSNFETAELRRSDIIFDVQYEQQIYDFLWFKASTGYSYNLGLRVSEENSFNNESLIKNEVTPSLLFNISLFVVPTSGLKKALGF